MNATTPRLVYGRWSGNPKGIPEDVTRCVVTVGGGTAWGPANEHQCGRKRGHGHGGLYCKQHGEPRLTTAPRAVVECLQLDDSSVRDVLKLDRWPKLNADDRRRLAESVITLTHDGAYPAARQWAIKYRADT